MMLFRRVWRLVLVCLASSATIWMLRPQTTFACSFTDLGCGIDVWWHDQLVSAVMSVWLFDRGLLLLARVVESLREWLLSDVLSTAFSATIKGVQSFFWITVLTAIIIFMLSYMLQSVIDLNWVSLRKALRNCVLAYLLLRYGSQGLATVEEVRLSIGQVFQGIAQEAVQSATSPVDFRATDDKTVPSDMQSIYGNGSSCPNMSLARKVSGMFLNDYAANFLRADGVDIHCPTASFSVPSHRENDSFADVYMNPADINDLEVGPRAEANRKLWNGIIQMILGIPLCLAAVLEQVMHLVFTISVTTVALGFVISLLFILFLPTEGMARAQAQMLGNVMKSSWMASFWVGLSLAMMGQATTTGNALIVFGFGLLVILMVVWQIKVAASVLMQAVESASGVVGNAPQALGGVAKGLGGAGLSAGMITGAVMTGGLGAVAGAMWQQQKQRVQQSATNAMGMGGRTASRHLGRTIGDRAQRRAAARGTEMPTPLVPDEGGAWYDEVRSDADLRDERNQALRERRFGDAQAPIVELRARRAAQTNAPASTSGAPATSAQPEAAARSRTTLAALREQRNAAYTSKDKDLQHALVPVVDELTWIEREMQAAQARGDGSAFRALHASRDASLERMSESNWREQDPDAVRRREQDRVRALRQAASEAQRGGNALGARQLREAAARIHDRTTPAPQGTVSAHEHQRRGNVKSAQARYDKQMADWERVRRARGEEQARPFLVQAETTLQELQARRGEMLPHWPAALAPRAARTAGARPALVAVRGQRGTQRTTMGTRGSATIAPSTYPPVTGTTMHRGSGHGRAPSGAGPVGMPAVSAAPAPALTVRPVVVAPTPSAPKAASRSSAPRVMRRVARSGSISLGASPTGHVMNPETPTPTLAAIQGEPTIPLTMAPPDTAQEPAPAVQSGGSHAPTMVPPVLAPVIPAHAHEPIAASELPLRAIDGYAPPAPLLQPVSVPVLEATPAPIPAPLLQPVSVPVLEATPAPIPAPILAPVRTAARSAVPVLSTGGPTRSGQRPTSPSTSHAAPRRQAPRQLSQRPARKERS